MAVARTGFRRRFGMWLAEEAGTLRSDIAKFADLEAEVQLLEEKASTLHKDNTEIPHLKSQLSDSEHKS